jgi:REP element-mobilizing transposase RayT
MAQQIATRGGARPGAGRKRAGRLACVPHRTRPAHQERHPMHVTTRRVPNLPSFRQQRVRDLVIRQMKRLNDTAFQIVHFSIQANHLHFLVEARDRATIIRKIQGLIQAFAKRLNAMLGGRRGKVWADRYYRRDVVTAREMNAVLRYVFNNAKKHGELPADVIMLDPYSSAWTFDGWNVDIPTPKNCEHWPRPAPRTRLLKIDWITDGLLAIDGGRSVHR